MATLILSPWLEEQLLEERRRLGQDRYDEVWDGVYVMSPEANDEHQEVVAGLLFVLQDLYGLGGPVRIRSGVNVSDRDEDWKSNFRIPDVTVFLPETQALNRGAYWLGGPEFAVEIVSEGERTRDKLDFYARVGVRELLIIDRDPWALELYRLEDGVLHSVGRITPGMTDSLASQVVPLSFRLAPAEGRPRIEVEHGARPRWVI